MNIIIRLIIHAFYTYKYIYYFILIAYKDSKYIYVHYIYIYIKIIYRVNLITTTVLYYSTIFNHKINYFILSILNIVIYEFKYYI